VSKETTIERELSCLAAFKKDCDGESRVSLAAVDEYTYWTEHVPVDEDYKCPIAYWVAYQEKWPRLTRMALDIFSIPAMSDEPERIFSLAGCMVTERRNRLKGDAIQAAQCLKNWYRANIKQLE